MNKALAMASLLSVLFLCGPGSIFAQALEGTPSDVLAAFLRQDYVTAARLAPAWAKAGDPTSEALLGEMYYTGRGEPFLPADGLIWLEKSAAQDYWIAYSLLGQINESGAVAKKDDVRALAWYILATRKIAPALFPNDDVKARDKIAATLTPEQRRLAQQAADEWIAAHGIK